MDDEFVVSMEEIDEPTCWRFITEAGFGRVGFVHDADVWVLPVNVAVVDHRVVFRTAAGTNLADSGTGSVVAFEADHTDRIGESGWSVMVRGKLWDVTERPEVAAWHHVLVRPWAPDPRNVWMMIEPNSITGRQIERRRRLREHSDAP